MSTAGTDTHVATEEWKLRLRPRVHSDWSALHPKDPPRPPLPPKYRAVGATCECPWCET